MKITRETPNGPELLATVEAPPDGDVNKVLEAIPQALNVEGKPISGVYDNVEFVDSQGRVIEPQIAQQYLTGGQQGAVTDNGEVTAMAATPANDMTQNEMLTCQELHNITSQTPLPGINCNSYHSPRRAKSKRMSLDEVHKASSVGSQRGTPTKSLSLPEEDAIQLYQPPEDGSEDDLEEVHTVECSSCIKCPKFLKKRPPALPKTFTELAKKRSGMTASEIHSDDKALPGLQALVANYARMLHEDKAQFVETLFRAVKINKTDVFRILCKIVQKSGFKLSSAELREPESSATILHVALLYNHIEIVDLLLEMKESELILAKYETQDYHNQTGLHVAVANGNTTIVEKLLQTLEPHERRVLINTVADGQYFRTQHPHGQLCLTAAAWAGNCEVIKLLVQNGGQLALKDYFGNTLLHSIILQSAAHPDKNDYLKLFDSVWDSTLLWAEQMQYETQNKQQMELEQRQMQINLFRELLTIRNNDGYTPLALATVKGGTLFEHMINLEKIYKIPQNKLGSIAWVTYDVTDITSFSQDSYNKFSVLHILAHSSQRLSRRATLDEEEQDFLDMEPMKAILECKWAVYRWTYILWLAIHLSYMIIFTAVTAEANSAPNLTEVELDLRLGIEHSHVHVGYAIFLILPLAYLILETLDVFGNRPYRIHMMSNQNYAKRIIKNVQSEWTITGNGPYRLVCVMFSCFTLQWFSLYAMRDPKQDMALAMSLLLGWIFVLFFTRGCRVTCRFSIMIQKMFFRDLIYFLTVYGIVLVGFSFAMNAMFSYKGEGGETINRVFYDMMNVVTDLDQKQSIDTARHPTFAKLMLIFYAIVAVILLMNMLIAMMNTSYETVRVTRCNLWKQQQLSILLMMERRFFWWKWLCGKSECDTWKKEAEDDVRCYLDVTMLHTPGYKCV